MKLGHSSQRAPLLLAPGLVFALSLAACSADKTIKLPTQPEADLAFAILYDDARIAEIGDVVRVSVLYSGAYGVSADQGGYEARVFFVALDALTDAATEVCSAVELAAARQSCLDQASRCATAPGACLKAVRAEEGCGTRLPLPDDFPLQAYADKDGRLEPGSGGADGAKLCGPSPMPTDCPLAIPGYVITEGERFRCVAPVSQRECEVSFDLSRCAIDSIVGTLGADGNLSDVRGPCQAEPLGAGDRPFGGAPGIAFVCGDRRFVASTMGLLFASPSCPRQGPGCFNSTGTSGGRITGIGVTGRAGPTQKLVLSGGGYDQCAASGCGSGRNCVDLCAFSCNSDFALDECATNDWPACTELSQASECNARCLKWCERDTGCYDDTSGPMFTSGPTDTPEMETSRLPLTGTGRWAAGMVPLSSGTFLAVTTSAVLIDAQAEPFELASTPLGMEGTGLVPVSNDLAVALGVTLGVAQLAQIQIDRSNSTLTVLPPTPVPGMALIDGAVAFGRDRDRIVVFSKDAPELKVLPLGGGAPVTVALPGKPTSIVTLPGGDVVVGIKSGDQKHALVRLEAQASGLGAPTMVPTIPGLEPTALALSPASCTGTQPAACQVLVGFHRSERPGPPLIGVAIENDAAPQSFHLTPALVEVALPTLDLLFPADATLWAGSSYHNRVMPVRLD